MYPLSKDEHMAFGRHEMFARVSRYLKPGSIPRFNYGLQDLRGDVTGGAIAGFLAIPASLSLGELSGLGPVAALYGVLTLGVFGALVGNTRGPISGVNTNVSIIMALVVAEYTNSIAEALAVAILAGVIQMVFGALRFGRYISYLPISLLNGYFTGIGIILITTQIAPAMGSAKVGGGVIGAVQALPFTIARANLDAVVITVIGLSVLFLWRGPLKRVAPGQLMLLIAGTLTGVLRLDSSPVVGPIIVGIPSIKWPEFSTEFLLRAVQPAFMIALLSSLGTITSSALVEGITGRQQQVNRIIFSHGMGNMANGLLGGMPGGVGQGTLANAFAGGRTFVSNLTVSAMVLLTLATPLSALIALIPKAVLASILISNGLNIIDWRLLRRIHRAPMGFWVVIAITVFLILTVDVLNGLLIGFVVGMLMNAREVEAIEVGTLVSVPLLDREILGGDADLEDPFGARTGLVKLPDRVSVASAREIGRTVGRDVGTHQVMIFDLTRTEYVDDTAAMMMGRLINAASARGRKDFVIAGMSERVAEKLTALGILDRVRPENLVPDIDSAKLAAKPMLEAALAAESEQS